MVEVSESVGGGSSDDALDAVVQALDGFSVWGHHALEKLCGENDVRKRRTVFMFRT